MSSKREEERNEKIIRGLIKLPPNRRCINCNSLGPQYVCTNFWTFICTTCSGIHREFTHRVKSVSMAKFTFQEVDALQKGGNQRARELYLKAWDFHRNRLPDNSNIDKLRDFIKNVYVDKKYSLENSAYRPPRDPQSLRSHEDETRRASSYHSYSQSPPYDFQYEERQYGKPAHSLTRNPDSNRGLYEGKLAGFLSLARLSDYTNDGRCANEGSYPRRSDFSGSGGSDPFRSDVLSPRYQRDIGSPFSETSRDISREVPPLHKSDTSSSKFHSQLWNAFDSADGHPTPTFVQINEQATASDAEKSLGDARYKYSSNYGSATTPNESEPPSSSLSSHFNMAPSDFPIGSEVAAVHLFETDHKSTNPFDLPNDSDMESTTMPQFWNMSSLQEALPNLQMSASYTGQLDQSWFTQNSVASFIPGGVLFDSPSGSLELMSGQAPNSSLSSIHTPAPVASVGGNPFA